MKIMIMLAVLLGFSATASAEIRFVKFENNQFTEVSTDQVQDVCKKNFAFREEHKAEAPKYLHGEILKAAFNGKMSPSLETVVAALRANPGMCAWVTPEERTQLK